MSSSSVVLFHPVLFGYIRLQKLHIYTFKNLKGRVFLGDERVDGLIILEQTLQQLDVKLRIGLKCSAYGLLTTICKHGEDSSSPITEISCQCSSLGCNAMWICRKIPMFWINKLLPEDGRVFL
jgi:hypothetical protein